jgi:hypothetical protein
MQGKKLFIGIANSQSTVPSLFFWSLLGIRQVLPTTIKRAGQSEAAIRDNSLIHAFLQSDCDYFVNMDIDQTYPSDYFEVMVPLIDEYKCIGPLIFDRWPESGYMPLVVKDKGFLPQRAKEILNQTGIIEVPFSHNNLFFAREVLEAVSRPWCSMELREDGLGKSFHQDSWQTKKIVDAGYKIYINCDVVVKHIVEIEIDREFHTQWHK